QGSHKPRVGGSIPPTATTLTRERGDDLSFLSASSLSDQSWRRSGPRSKVQVTGPRSWRRVSRHSFVSTSATAAPSEVNTIPYTFRATDAEIFPSSPSASTDAGARSSGSPYPAPPATYSQSRSPGWRTIIFLDGSSSRVPSLRTTNAYAHAPGAPPSRPHGDDAKRSLRC